jgi:iron complex transport system substrate-binding protein
MYPRRIVCLGAELPDIFFRLGALDRVVGISAYTEGPPEALSLPKVSGFRHGSARRILAQEPDLIILTSTVQRPLADALGGHGVPILHLYPHRLADLFDTVRLLGTLVNQASTAEALVHDWQAVAARAEARAATLPRRPAVYFEEWMDPLVTGIGWVSDLITLAGGRDIFRARAETGRTAEHRTVAPDEVVRAAPDLILASWCGKPLDKARLVAREGWDAIPAVRRNAVVELASTVLQCGPRLFDVLPHLQQVIEAVANESSELPGESG